MSAATAERSGVQRLST